MNPTSHDRTDSIPRAQGNITHQRQLGQSIFPRGSVGDLLRHELNHGTQRAISTDGYDESILHNLFRHGLGLGCIGGDKDVLGAKDLLGEFGDGRSDGTGVGIENNGGVELRGGRRIVVGDLIGGTRGCVESGGERRQTGALNSRESGVVEASYRGSEGSDSSHEAEEQDDE